MQSSEPIRRLSERAADVVLPAGGRIAGEFARQAGVEVKALIALDGQTILRRTIETLRRTERVGRIVVVGPDAALEEARACGVEGALAEGETGPENILRGLAWLENAASQALVVTSDLPFLTPDSLAAFLDACPSHADLAVPLVTRQAFEALFPGTDSEYVALRDGAFTLGCAFLVKPQAVLHNRAHLERLFAARKSQWQMARLIGARAALRFLTKRLTVQDIVDRASHIVRFRGHAILDAPAELAFDIDLPADYDYALACTRKR
jgi:GTP:adenosylcobinamide-phosphate guanylyltransferase